SSNSEKSKANIVISSIKQAPPVGCVVNLKVQPVDYSGGHSHDGSRPRGTVTPSSISFSEGETGKSAKYISSEVSGKEKIVTEVKGKVKSCVGRVV
ncbi:MAG: hypothetical protein HY752_03355, partial [Nitrospirae bacterium]|nr:hypothetical protein [Nitrospirota bacterium]